MVLAKNGYKPGHLLINMKKFCPLFKIWFRFREDTVFGFTKSLNKKPVKKWANKKVVMLIYAHHFVKKTKTQLNISY